MEYRGMKCENVSGIAVINICDFDSVFGTNFNTPVREFMSLLEEIDAHYYGQSREVFSIHDAVMEAKQMNRAAVVVEDLS
jgi:hypothetical protein